MPDTSEEVAGEDQIRAAIEALTPAQLVKLSRFAGWRIGGLGRAARRRDHDDLLQEAITTTLAGRRRWKPAKVDFFGHLRGAVRSISSNWKEQFRPEEAVSESDLVPEHAGAEAENPFAEAPAATPTPERTLAAKEALGVVLRLFADDDVACLVLEGFREKMRGPEIQADLGISPKDYEAAVKRIRRTVRKLMPEGASNA